ncbi:HCO3 transporter family-domain-containing protein [Massariosphaeria phaeospora]|uniref:HCO3 transporter family-domain-containing protein n=1 Tax=Massariosphaeria phaeospora TaxID=100035 RepID=A0A7C8IKS8_9PLEO|nr:HCO3 transporter family-domain-containing protein [Massariosphaeria phaeospora]
MPFPSRLSRLTSLFAPAAPLQPFRLLRQDLRNLPARYASDWRVFNQLVFASAVYVFFTNLLPGITFASDLYNLTGRNWGTIEVVLSTGVCGVVFSLFSIQPLTILGVTGPFSILAENIYTLCHTTFHIPFLPFMAWSLLHAAWLHYLLAIFNAHDWTMRYVTTFSTEIFSLLNSIIYVHKAIQELQRAHTNLSFAAFLYSVIGAIGTCLLAIVLSTAERWKPLFHRYVRMGLAEYAAAISIIVFIALPHAGELAHLDKETLHVSTSFRPTAADRRVFFVRFWELPGEWIAAALVPGFIITALFFFDHEVSSIICTVSRYGTRKPGGFAWDIVLLGTTTALCGVLGIPPANGLLPQAPLHAESLMHDDKEAITLAGGGDGDGGHTETRVSRRVYEQRWSHLLHAVGILAFTSPPLMRVLGLTPTSVLAGLFLFMGEQSLAVNPILYRTFQMLTPPSELPALPPALTRSSASSSSSTASQSQSQNASTLPTPLAYLPIHLYTLSQILITTLIFIVTLTKAGPAFPIIIIALVPIRLKLMNKLWNREVLRYVDAWACREGTVEDEEDRRKGLGGSGNGSGSSGADDDGGVGDGIRRSGEGEWDWEWGGDGEWG